jgi:hypothetical protein
MATLRIVSRAFCQDLRRFDSIRKREARFRQCADGAFDQWRKDPPGELLIALVADERFGRVTGWIEAS